MKKGILFLGIVTVFGFCGQLWALTPTLDGMLNEWTGADVVNLGTQPASGGGSYTLLATWDDTNLYLGVDRNSSDRYLGDSAGIYDSFFVAIDVDGLAGSGGSQDGYGTVNFNGTRRPDFVYNYAGGEGWYETCSWNGSAYNWLGWSNAGTYYGWSESNPNDELVIPLSTIGGSYDVMLWAWMTTEGVYDSTKASWPAGSTGIDPTFGEGLPIKRVDLPYDPDPKNGAVVGTDSVTALSWTNPDPNNPTDTITCDVYFLDAGTSKLTIDPNMGPAATDPGVVQIADDTTAETVTLPGSVLPLVDNHYYYWAVHATDPNSGDPVIIKGYVWYFYTGDAASVPSKPVDQYMYLSQDDSAYDGGENNPNVRWFQVTASYTDDGKSPIADANLVNLSWGWDPANGQYGVEKVSQTWTPGAGTHTSGTVTAVYKTHYVEGDPDNTTTLPGNWNIRLEVTDGTGTAYGIAGYHEIWETCGEAAAADPSDTYDGYYDRNSDCIVNLADFAVFAEAWLSQSVKYE